MKCGEFFKANLFLIMLLFSGCIPLPDLEPARDPRTNLIFYNKQSTANKVYPQEEWWKLYHDPQLNSLIEEGLAKSPGIAEAKARFQKANGLVQQASAPLFPFINVEGSLQKYRQSYNMGIPPAFVPKGFQDTALATLNFDYKLDLWGENQEKVSAALSEAAAHQLEIEQARIMLSTLIATTYGTLAQLYAELDAAKDAVVVRSKTTQLLEERFHHGLENKGSVEQAKYNQAKAEADVTTLEELINLTRNKLAALVGDTPTKGLSIQHVKMPNSRLFTTPLTIPADLLGHRPDIVAARLKLEAAAHRINIARVGFYPNINLSAFIGQQSLGLSKFFKTTSLTSAVGPALHLPIFNREELEGRYQEARAEYDISLAHYESAIIQALQEVADVMTSQNAWLGQMKNTKAAFEASKRAHKVMQDRYRGGIASYLELLAAEDALILSRRFMIQTQARMFILEVALAKALGGGF